MTAAPNMTVAPRIQGAFDSQQTPGNLNKQVFGGTPIGGTRTAPTPPTPVNTTSRAEQILNDRAAEAKIQQTQDAAERDRLIAERRGRITDAWSPVYSNIDQRLQSLPGERSSMEGQLENLVGGQLSNVESQRGRAVEGLEQQKVARGQEAKKGFRNLEEDVRNQLDAYGQKLGVSGAADSSAAGQVAAAIGKQALRGRGDIIDARSQAFQEIDFRISDTNAKADEARNEIETAKRNQLFEIGKFYSDRIGQLTEARANASAQQQSAINSMIEGLENEFLSRAQSLDDEVRTYRSSIDQWQLERQAVLEDYAKQLQTASQFNSAPYTQATNAALAGFNQSLTGGNFSQPVNNRPALQGDIGAEEDPIRQLLLNTEGLQVL